MELRIAVMSQSAKQVFLICHGQNENVSRETLALELSDAATLHMGENRGDGGGCHSGDSAGST